MTEPDADALTEPVSDTTARQRWVTGSVALSVVLAVVVLCGGSRPQTAERRLAEARLESRLGALPQTPQPIRIVPDAAPVEPPQRPRPEAAPATDSRTSAAPLATGVSTLASTTPKVETTDASPATTAAAATEAPPADGPDAVAAAPGIATMAPASRLCTLPPWPRVVAVGDSHSTEVRANGMKKRHALPSYVELFQRTWERQPTTGPTPHLRGSRLVHAYPGRTSVEIALAAQDDLAADANVTMDPEITKHDVAGRYSGWRADVCFILVGTNDVINGVPLQRVVDSVLALWAMCARIAPAVVVQAVPPAHCYPNTQPFATFEASRTRVNRCLVRLLHGLRTLSLRVDRPVVSCDGGPDGSITVRLPERAARAAAPCRQLALFHDEELAVQLAPGRVPVAGNASTYEAALDGDDGRPPLRRPESVLKRAFTDCVHLSEESRVAYAERLATFLRAGSGAVGAAAT